MRWKQFLMPVDSMNADELRAFINAGSERDFNLVDVRQPGEYEAGHIPGAKLIPLPVLSDRLGELPPSTPVVVYCASGGRSHAAAQLMSAQGFERVYNFKGGFRAWNGHRAVGRAGSGMRLFTGGESLESTLIAAYGMEAALADMYRTKAEEVTEGKARKIFALLAGVETKHMQRILDTYLEMKPGSDPQRLTSIEIPAAMEGGMTMKEYSELYFTDFNNPLDVVDLAMSIEAQGMDLYLRAADAAGNPRVREFLTGMSAEEKEHLKMLGDLMDSLIATSGDK